MKKIPSHRLRFIYGKKKMEMSQLIKIKKLDTFDSSQISHLSNMQEEAQNKKLRMEEKFLSATNLVDESIMAGIAMEQEDNRKIQAKFHIKDTSPLTCKILDYKTVNPEPPKLKSLTKDEQIKKR